MTAPLNSYQLLAELFAALASPVRLGIIDLLAQEGELSMGSISGCLGVSRANVSQHLMVLRRHDIVSARKLGTNVLCRIADPRIPRALDLLKEASIPESVDRPRITPASLEVP